MDFANQLTVVAVCLFLPGASGDSGKISGLRLRLYICHFRAGRSHEKMHGILQVKQDGMKSLDFHILQEKMH